ncbi:SMP-30/gluconolactonase/LRE family protein [Opitutia bacterium ISCC 51]|nr:SMP-30/gluconolactonase/LRE family protein [Opitutae bacterium ISCC 51]QXD27956.1 SMP-30/gluconolactonase/LRE family protein [Opitutae bacterium ISCC 52]
MKNYPSLSRRSFLKSSSLASAAAFLPACGKQAQVSGISERYKDLNSSDYLGTLKTETRIDDSAIFTEGPAVDREGNVYFTNIRVSKILKWDPKKKALSIFRENSNAANGLRFDPQGNLLACEGASGRVTRTNLRTGEISVLADSFAGKQLQSPNDLDYDSHGRIYFTSRGNNPDLEKENLKAVYRLDPNGRGTQLLAEPDVHMPNGIIVSPDEKTLHLIEAHGEASKKRCIVSYKLAADGSLSKRSQIIDFYPGRSGDGMCVDEAGNLYVAAGLHNERGSSETLDTRPGIHVISPEGELLAFVETPEDTITNCTFGGEDLKTLYITSGSHLLSLRTTIAGKASYRPQS